MVAEDCAPSASACASLIDSLCARGMASEAYAALEGMHEAGRPLSVKLCCQTLVALLRTGQVSRAFHAFEEH